MWLCDSLFYLNTKVVISKNNAFSRSCLTIQAPTPQNGQTHSHNSSTTAYELLQDFCVDAFEA